MALFVPFTPICQGISHEHTLGEMQLVLVLWSINRLCLLAGYPMTVADFLT